MTSRRCKALEADHLWFNLSVERLKDSATTYLDSSLRMIDIAINESQEGDRSPVRGEASQIAQDANFRAFSDDATEINPSTSGSEMDQATSYEEEQAK